MLGLVNIRSLVYSVFHYSLGVATLGQVLFAVIFSIDSFLHQNVSACLGLRNKMMSKYEYRVV